MSLSRERILLCDISNPKWDVKIPWKVRLDRGEKFKSSGKELKAMKLARSPYHRPHPSLCIRRYCSQNSLNRDCMLKLRRLTWQGDILAKEELFIHRTVEWWIDNRAPGQYRMTGLERVADIFRQILNFLVFSIYLETFFPLIKKFIFFKELNLLYTSADLFVLNSFVYLKNHFLANLRVFGVYFRIYQWIVKLQSTESKNFTEQM